MKADEARRKRRIALERKAAENSAQLARELKAAAARAKSSRRRTREKLWPETKKAIGEAADKGESQVYVDCYDDASQELLKELAEKGGYQVKTSYSAAWEDKCDGAGDCERWGATIGW